jgi:hypothetical protein
MDELKQHQMLIITVRLLDPNGKLTTITTSAIAQQDFENAINSFETRAARFDQTVEGVEVKLTADPFEDQRAFAECWSAIRDNRDIPFSKKFAELAKQFRTTTMTLFETHRLKDVLRARAYEIKQKIQDRQ